VHKLVLAFRKPDSIDRFEALWSENFVGLAERMPGIKRVTVSRIYGSPDGQPELHLVHEFFFEDADALAQAVTSPEGQAAGKALMSFAAEYVEVSFAEHLEEDRE
jgi:uncharacterized protein (TIGR02118 family)